MMMQRLFLAAILLVFWNTPNAFAGKDEIRIFLTKQSVTKYANGAQSAEQLLLTAGMVPWEFKANSHQAQSDNSVGELVRVFGFKEILEAEGMLAENGRISDQARIWIREVLSEWVDLTGVKINYGVFELRHPTLTGAKILYSIGLENLTLAKAKQLQQNSGWAQ